MTALAEILAARGAHLSGSDVADTFYTDAILAGLGMKLGVGFEASTLPAACDLVIHSAAYPRESNPQLLEAARRGLPVLSYPEALGALSRLQDSSGIAGVHGKTTTTALAGSLVAALALPATTIAGSAVSSFATPGFPARSTRIVGDRYLIAETCEYRRHFLHFSPRRIVLTSIESDHQDFFPTYADIRQAFLDYIASLDRGGSLIYCADDPGATSAALEAGAARPDLRLLPYGESASGDWRLVEFRSGEGRSDFRVAGIERTFSLRVPGRHVVLDAVAALALATEILATEEEREASASLIDSRRSEVLAAALLAFAGSKRRSEILGEARGVLFMDDYGHHPTAIDLTIRGIRDFWPSRRLVVDFMSHTYSRTKALLPEFAAALDGADEVVLHGIYASAREAPDPAVSGVILAEAVRARATSARHAGKVTYVDSPLGALDALAASLRPGDLFLTMGAGDNWKLGATLLERLRGEEGRA